MLADYLRDLVESSVVESDFVCRRISRQVENELFEIGYDSYPDDYFSLILEVFSNNKIYIKEGVFHFVLMLCTDFEILSNNQKNSLYEVINSNFRDYCREKMNLSICELISTHYEPVLALDFLEKLQSTGQTEDVENYIIELQNVLKSS